MNSALARIQRRLDAQAIDQLRAEVARLSTLLEDTEKRLYWAEMAADDWQRDAENLSAALNSQGHRVGITKAGQLVAPHERECQP